MCEFNPYYTADGSVGLYSKEFDDIFHSATGALTEAYEKFIFQIDWNNLLKNEEINILDICYGIGYNSKSFLNFLYKIFEKMLSSKKDIDTIYTNNNSKTPKPLLSYIDKINTDKMFSKISVDAIDMDKNLFFLSPFIKTGETNFKNYNKNIPTKILKYFEKPIEINKFNNEPFINYFILSNIIKNSPEILLDKSLLSLLKNDKFTNFFDRGISLIFKQYADIMSNCSLEHINLSDLHNIYYNHISSNYKTELNTYLLQHCSFNPYYEDARLFIQNSKKIYNVIFLDAFTPSKCPCLWSYEFFQQLFNNMNNDSVLLTYSTSASIRSAMLSAGFNIGYAKNKNREIIGTIASRNSDSIKYPLSEYDLGLLKTKAGIFYRDNNLSSQNEAIIASRQNEVILSTLQSSSQYKKQYNSRKLV